MGLKFNLDPTLPKVIIIAFLLIAEAIIVPTLAIVQSSRMPTQLEMLVIFLSALVQLVTFMITFVETGSVPAVPAVKPLSD